MAADQDAEQGQDRFRHDARAGAARRLLLSGKIKRALLAGLGGFAAIFCLAFLTQRSGTLLLIAPFGASCVLVFALPKSPLAQPRNLVGGHLVSTLTGLAVFAIFGASPLAFGLGVGLAITAMLLTDTTHPPAGADPIVVILAGASWPFLFTPVLAGALVIACLGWGFHRYVTGSSYPD